MKYNMFDLGQIEAILNMLGGENGAKRFLAGKTKVVNKEFEVWRTIKLGTVKSVEDFPKQMGPYKSDNPSILQSSAFKLSPEEIEVDLVRCTPFEFGFKDDPARDWRDGVASLRHFYANAIMCGLQLCPAEVGPQLHVQWSDRTANQGVHVGMEPIQSDGADNSEIFSVGTNFKGQYLSCMSGTFGPHCEFVFIKSRKQS